ncbi:MAG: hypothetical protein U5L11_16735 [Arhodomonas sp.]|nr:hypothetical protein [Arhodomonas sp.]
MYAEGYRLGIPLGELRATALQVACRCGGAPVPARMECARTVVREDVCPCLLEATPVLEALSREFCEWVRAGNRPEDFPGVSP